ncbi:hypothetical protein CYMTET_29051 [Cymbomonas tetramitiformis]|uniref:Uncharacterized protein n=1 Tax=Cymbomonas tetramitiformis TaxID=36881 RepID=A0AAE0FLV3_9CHLO|nr:hypothetical protein CYMTET_29051 [Cymbomonas tetramitiformis]
MYWQNGVTHRKTFPHWQNFMAEYAIDKISRVSRAILDTYGMDLTYWPLADSHSRLLWDTMPHGDDAVLPHYHLLGHHFTYRTPAWRYSVLGVMAGWMIGICGHSTGGVSRPPVLAGRFVGALTSVLGISHTERREDKMVPVGKPLFIRKYSGVGQYAMADPTYYRYFMWYDLVQWLDRRRTVDCINQFIYVPAVDSA